MTPDSWNLNQSFLEAAKHRYSRVITSTLMVRLLMLICISVVMVSCTATRFIPKEQTLLNRNEVVIEGKAENFVKSDLEYLIAQKPNNKFLGMRFALWFHYFTGKRQGIKVWDWLHERTGQEPVYVDEMQYNNTATQLSRYVYNKGYFDNSVRVDVKRRKNRLGTIIYHVSPGQPYRLASISQTIPDSVLSYYVDSIASGTLIRQNAVYDAYQMDSERDRITTYLRNNGYFDFTKDYIRFDVDTSLHSRQLNVNMIIDNPVSIADNQATDHHKRYFIHEVFVFPNHNPFVASSMPYDTSFILLKNTTRDKASRLTFLSHGDKRIKASIFKDIVQIYEDDPFSMTNLRQTYKGLTNLKIYRASNISFDAVRNNLQETKVDTNWLNCNIYLQRSKANAYSFELEGTNSGGDLGIRGSLVFTNKNLFKGGEVFRLRLNGGFEAQRVNQTGLEGQTDASIFNTFESGMDANINFPRFLSFGSFQNFARIYQPKTNINVGFNDQNRQLYSRTIIKAAFGYEWMNGSTLQHLLTPINLSSVKVRPSPFFQEFLDAQTNQRFKDQYSDHLIFSVRYSLIFNNQNVNKLTNFIYYRINLESAGNLLALLNQTPLLTAEQDYHTLLGIRYAQYVRADQDFRYYHLLSKEHRLVYRAMMGIGVPYGNSEEMPFERSYYSGGSNGMRGWQLRQLGPGSFTDTLNLERIGDIQLEFNVEYRFPIWSFLKGALFVDAGNIWTLRDQSYFTNGSFKFDQFYKEIALDAGVGFRFDFSFFIFRLDTAIPLRDPEITPDQRWRFTKLQLKQLVWNFGIGYPF